MLPEQEQPILGYFIEEASYHLNIIEQGLLNLQNTLKDAHKVSEVFRAAQSIKAGAETLGLHSIQQTAHRLEDYFQVLKECPQLQVDQKLESLFLRVFDTLQELLEQLQGSFVVREDMTNNLMLEMEPVFEALSLHLGLLVNKAELQEHTQDSAIPVEAPDSLSVFQNQVLHQLQQMSQLFKQPETSQTRQQLEECCQQLVRLGEEFNLPGWCTLCETASGAIALLENTYDTLAPIVINELTQAHELILAGREAEIITSEQLQLLSLATFSFWEDTSTSAPLAEQSKISDTSSWAFLNDVAQEYPTNPPESEIEMAELNGFIDLFEVDAFELDEARQQEEIGLGSGLGLELELELELEALLPSPDPSPDPSPNPSPNPSLEDTPLNLDTEEFDFKDLFDTAEETEESLEFLEVLNSDDSIVDTDLSDFWEEGNKAGEASDSALDGAGGELFATTVYMDNPPSASLTPKAPSALFLDKSEDLWFDIDLADAETIELDEEKSAEFSEYPFGTDTTLDHELNAQDMAIEAMPNDLVAPTDEMVDNEGKSEGENTFSSPSPEPSSFEGDFDGLEDFADLEALLGEEEISASNEEADLDEFSVLEALLDLDTPTASNEEADLDEFSVLEALLDLDTPAVLPVIDDAASSTAPDLSAAVSEADEFGDLEKLLQQIDTTDGRAADSEVVPAGDSPKVKPLPEQAAPVNNHRPAFEQTMRVPVKQLDNVNNLVGELVVNRNSLEQDHERLRQFLDNLLHQVQQLSDVGARMQQLYERSLMESSLNAIRQGSGSAFSSSGTASKERHATGVDFDALEMDRFTGFHTLSQEMIELIVRVRESSSDIEFVTDETEQVARQLRQVTSHLQEALTRSRMIPFAQIADRLPRAVRDITLKYGKQAQLNIEGRDTLIDKMLLEQLYDPMTHLVNNSITHGIETPLERSAKNKSPVGQITIRAFHQGNQTVISVGDDGAGIDTERVKAKAIEKGLIAPDEAKTMSRLDVYNLLFHPGFSTKDKVDDFAGRGVGMDVVRTSLSEIRGVINTDSTLGKGTTFTIRLPLTLSICKALCCISDKARIAFPMDGVEDMLDVPASSLQVNAEGQSCILWRDSLLPFRPLKELLNYNRQLSRGNVYGGNREDDMISIVVLRTAGTIIALQVDQVLGEQEIVIKQFEGPAPKPVGVAGATVLGDGRIMPIADVLELIDLSMGRIQPESGRTLWATSAAPLPPETPASVKTEPMVLIVDDSITVRELLSMTFNKAGYRVQQARDGQEAWEKLRDGLPCDIVFCDIEMPRMDGLELLSRMQKDPTLSQLPIAMLTSRGADRHRQMAIQLGASGYFTKPYLEEALLDGAQRMLKGEVLVASST